MFKKKKLKKHSSLRPSQITGKKRASLEYLYTQKKSPVFQFFPNINFTDA